MLPYPGPSSSTITKAPELGSVVSLRFAFNTTAPANHLPYELVVQILASGAWTRWQELIALTHICQHWRSVALGTPQLWADAARSVFAGPCMWYGRAIRWPKCLLTFLARSEPSPLAVYFPDHLRLTVELSPGGMLLPHVSRLARLCVYVETTDALQAVLWLAHTQMRNLESLHIHQVDQLNGVPFSLEKLPPWGEADLPRLHKLTMHGHYFGRAIAVASLKTLVLYEGAHSHNVFLAALERCGSTLESLTLRDWSHPVKNAMTSTIGTVQLPRLHRLEVSIPTKNSATAPPTSLFAALSLPSDIMIDLDWRSNPGNTLELLPKHFTSDLHAPPSIDSMCLHLSSPSPRPLASSLHGYVDGKETLRVREEPLLDLAYHKRHCLGLLGRFPEGHLWSRVMQLAVVLDVDKLGYDWDVQRLPALEHLLYTFVRAFPRLRRLDVLGRSIGGAKLRMVDAFLDLPYLSEPSEVHRSLGYVCDVPEHAETTMATGFTETLSTQLDALEAHLTSHLAQGGSRLHRLELCIACPTRSSHSLSRRGCPGVRDVEPNTALTEHLLSMYLLRFEMLVDEVVFMRGAQTQARKPGYRIITRAEPGHLVPGSKPYSVIPRHGSRETRRGRKGR